MLIKLGVSIHRLRRPCRRSLAKVDRVFRRQGFEAVITSTFEGNHGPSSLHYSDEAYDLRKPAAPPTFVLAKLKESLGPDFDVVDERDHFHIEYDPK